MNISASQKPKKKKTAADVLYYEHRGKWIEAIFNRPDVTHADFRVLYFIAKRSGHEHRGCFWSVPMIADKCQCSTKSVSEATAKAGREGWLKVKTNPGRQNFYAPIFFWL